MAKIKFELPDGMEIPNDAKPGETFDALATLRIEKDGKLCLEALDGNPVEGYEREEEPEAPEKGYVESVTGQMG